jgi:hypothetical protein
MNAIATCSDGFVDRGVDALTLAAPLPGIDQPDITMT